MHAEANGAGDEARALFFPERGSSMSLQQRRRPAEVGLDGAVAERVGSFVAAHPVEGKAQRWALWRNGHLVHCEGDFDATVEVASLRKTWHAMIVGAAIAQGRIPSLDQKISVWQTELTGKKAEATWRHVLTQSAGFDYPHPDFPEIGDPDPGSVWTYSDWNLVHLCDALAKVYGKKGFRDHYEDVAAAAYFDAIGMDGWGTSIVFDRGSGMEDGVRFHLSLEHMGRLGLLALARGRWRGEQLVPEWFVQELETKRTRGMRVNYNGPYDGRVHLRFHADRFPEAPYGYLTWVNTDRDYFAGADAAWACGQGAGGNTVLWNHRNGVVFAATGFNYSQLSAEGVPHILESCLRGPVGAPDPSSG